jgi:acetyltransferase
MNTIHLPVDRKQASATAAGTQIVRLADGDNVYLRTANPFGGDNAALRRLFFTLGDTTRYLYFCAAIPATTTWAERFVSLGNPGGDCSYVLVAEVGHELVGFARFSPVPHTDPHVRELGIVLSDAWQGRGLGGHMLCRLAAEAQAREVTAFAAVVLWENRRMLRLVRRIFPDMQIACSTGSCDLILGFGDNCAQKATNGSQLGEYSAAYSPCISQSRLEDGR